MSGSEVNRYKKLHIHRIHAEAEMRKLGVSSKLNAEPDFLTYLFELGRHTADTWLKVHYEDLGHKSSINIVDTYL